MSAIHLSLLIHAHQPVGNFDDVLEGAYARCYLPFVECLELHRGVRLALHYTGPLLEWIERRHPEYFERLRALAGRGQVELVGGGFYEPILVAIPPEDRREQITRLADYLEQRFGARPRGAWLAERVWEPHLAATFAECGVDYTLVDDTHFLAAGFTPQQLYGDYTADELGRTVRVIPGLMSLRYFIPFRSVEDNIAWLRRAAEENPGGMAAMGDDMEKFGVWPETFDHCYTRGWLDHFFSALEGSGDWLRLTPPGEYLAAHPPLGRADLPAASYAEMMEWALPTAQRRRFHALSEEFRGRDDLKPFLRGGFWRGFFSKYAESNLLHKTMLRVSAKVRRLASSARRGLPVGRALDDAATRLLRAQCNDAYWHGIFGGIYAPHLRTALWRELVAAETLADAVEQGRASYTDLERGDLDADGREELLLVSERYAALVDPAAGGVVAALDARQSGVTLINSIQRREEPYHSRLAGAPGGGGGVASIHNRVRSKEEGLEARLRYDRWPRHCFRLLLFPEGKEWADYDALRLEEAAETAGGAYAVAEATAETVVLRLAGAPGAPWAGDTRLEVRKVITLARAEQGFTAACEVELKHAGGAAWRARAGLEVIVNLLAPDAPDRWFESGGQRFPLSWGGALPGATLRATDEWQNVSVALEAEGAEACWVAPIETVSESEEGFERVYQGSQILPVWSVELASGGRWSARVALHVTPAK